MLKNKAIILILFILWFSCNLLFSQQENSSSEEIKIIAIYKEKIKDHIFALGNVEIHYNDIKIFADRAELNTETKDVNAEGNLTICFSGEEVVSGLEGRLNLDSYEGEIKKASGMLQPTFFYEAETIKRNNEDIYSFQKARMTSCTQPIPRWNFSCARATLKKNDYVEMWNSVLSIKRIPVFYIPYLRYPLNRERSTGFLMPQIGFSGAKGFSYTQSYYWIIKRNMDATFTGDFFSAKGLGSGLEYRYLFSGGVGGQLNLYYFNYMKGSEASSTAYLFRFKHNQPLPLKFNLVADIDYSSSFNFLREFDNDFRRAVVSNRSSQAYISKAWSYFNFNLRMARFETYFRENDTSIINYNLPSISFSSSKMKLFSPFYFSFSSAFSHWEYGWDSEYKAGTQRRSQNLSFSPELSFPYTSLPWLTINSSFSPQLNYYFQSYAPATSTIVDEPIFRANYEVKLDLVGPVFYKIYYANQGNARLKHVIEPSLSYCYESPVADSKRIITPWFFYRNNYIRYGLTNRFLVKEEKMPREVFALNISQTFYLSPENSPMQPYRVNGGIPEFSDIEANLRFYPARRYSLDVSAGFNPYYKTFSSLRLGASVGTPDDPAFLRVNWYKSTNPYYKEIIGYDVYWDRHQIGFSGGLKIPRLSLDTLAEVDFNIQERELLYTGLSFVYHYQCIDLKGDLKIFYFRDKPETQFRISFGLGNIGRTTDFFGGLLL